ncbi:hypothetical protein BKI52_11335 [marine bacterium AO1-C]|nr:hypothetical protein BKI52_11335 [marine bacterium AO1-C]
MMITQILLAISTGILGIFLGTQICEGALLVPYWKSLAPQDFFELHKTYGKKIHQFYAPLTIAATFVPLITAGYSIYSRVPYFKTVLGMAICCLLFFATYFLYFKQANLSFATQSLSFEELPKELHRWGNWHWTRVGLEFLAFGFSLVALLQHNKTC